MKARFRVICRGNRGGTYYCVDTKTGERTSLGTTDEKAARKIVAGTNDADQQPPPLNLHLAKAYLAGTDGAMTTRA